MSELTKAKFNGIALYDIQMNGCLNGVYTNTGACGEICNEINKKKKSSTSAADTIVGEYDCLYFDQQGELTITKPSKDNVYHFSWDIDGQQHEGVGYKMNDRQIAVSYWFL